MNLKFFVSIFYLFLLGSVSAQLPSSSFSFSCPRDTVIPCGVNCFTLTAKIPVINASSGQYTVNKTDCFRPDVSPATPGIGANLTINDTYSPAIILPFDFPFFDIFYNQLAISGNGAVSFDLSNAGAGAQWVIQGLDGSLPSGDYERAIIMGVFHDIDMSRTNSPTRQIKYDITGTAPHRKFIVSFNKIPCFQCNNLIDNTYQITLYEGLGIVEVNVFERQVCTTWNAGGAMIGMQNYDRNKGIMAPERSAFTTPRWQGTPMNETWRFAPNSGSSLLKKVELYTTAGELVAEGDTVNDGNGNYTVSFDNICPLANEVTYLVKSTYKNIDDLSADVFGVDTIIVSRESPIAPVLQVQDACPGIANGSITINNPVGVGYSYSINTVTFQSAPQFTDLAPGVYIVAVLNNETGCVYDTSAEVNTNYRVNTAISYSRNIYCNGQSLSPAPVIDGINGGTFTVDIQGLDINVNTGVINTAASDTGDYTITYHINTTDSCVNPVSITTLRIVNDTQFVWTGAIDNSWENAGNWSCNNLPTAASNVIIYNGNVVINSNVTINRLTVNPGANVTVNSGFNLTVLNP